MAGELYYPRNVGMRDAWDRVHTAQKRFNESDFWSDREPFKALRNCFACAPDDMMLTPPVYFDYGNRVFFGKNFYANTGLTILDENTVKFGDNVFLGPHVNIYTACHPIDAQIRNTKIQYAKPVEIGSNVWIGGGVIINPGVTIGDEVVIGSGSVVVHNIPSYSVAAGNPCKVIRQLTEEDHLFWKRKYDEYINYKEQESLK